MRSTPRRFSSATPTGHAPRPALELTPDAAPRELLGRLGRSAADCIAVVGHEPHLSALLRSACREVLASGSLLRKMGVALVRFRGRARPGRGQLVWFAPPRLLRAVRKSPLGLVRR